MEEVMIVMIYVAVEADEVKGPRTRTSHGTPFGIWLFLSLDPKSPTDVLTSKQGIAFSGLGCAVSVFPPPLTGG